MLRSAVVVITVCTSWLVIFATRMRSVIWRISGCVPVCLQNGCVFEPDRQWRSSSFQESKKVRVSRDLWPWPWPWAHSGCMLTWSPSCASLVAIRPFAWEKKRFAQKFTDGRTDGQTDRRRTPRHCISSFLEWAKNNFLPYIIWERR